MKAMINRFWDWIFHPGVKWFRYPHRKTVSFKFPATGNNQVVTKVQDYKLPYAQSRYNIRYKRPTPQQTATYVSKFLMHPLADYPSSQQKLIAFGFLRREQINDPRAISKARQDYIKTYDRPVELKVQTDDFGNFIPQMNEPQSFRVVVQNSFESRRIFNLENPIYDLKDIYHPTPILLESLDLFAGDPNYQQSLIEIEYKLDQISKNIYEAGEINLVRGSKNFWKALDSSNDSHNIEAVQRQIRDPQPTNYTINQVSPIKLIKDPKNGEVLDVLPS